MPIDYAAAAQTAHEIATLLHKMEGCLRMAAAGIAMPSEDGATQLILTPAHIDQLRDRYLALKAQAAALFPTLPGA